MFTFGAPWLSVSSPFFCSLCFPLFSSRPTICSLRCSSSFFLSQLCNIICMIDKKKLSLHHDLVFLQYFVCNKFSLSTVFSFSFSLFFSRYTETRPWQTDWCGISLSRASPGFAISPTRRLWTSCTTSRPSEFFNVTVPGGSCVHAHSLRASLILVLWHRLP